MKERTERQTLLLMVWLRDFCPECAAKGVKSKLVVFHGLGSQSPIRNYCQRCHKAWSGRVVFLRLFEKITNLNIINFLEDGGKIPEEIFTE